MQISIKEISFAKKNYKIWLEIASFASKNKYYFSIALNCAHSSLKKDLFDLNIYTWSSGNFFICKKMKKIYSWKLAIIKKKINFSSLCLLPFQ